MTYIAKESIFAIVPLPSINSIKPRVVIHYGSDAKIAYANSAIWLCETLSEAESVAQDISHGIQNYIDATKDAKP